MTSREKRSGILGLFWSAGSQLRALQGREKVEGEGASETHEPRRGQELEGIREYDGT